MAFKINGTTHINDNRYGSFNVSNLAAGNYTDSTKPSNPTVGDIIFNTESLFFEMWNGTIWETFGSSAGGGLSVQRYNTSGVLQSTLSYDLQAGSVKLEDEGYYVMTVTGSPISVNMWAWGGGGSQGGGPGPGGGGAGGGARGKATFEVGDKITALSVDTTTNSTSNQPEPGGYTDGGGYTTGRYNGAGGGSSRIADGEIPFANINNPTTLPFDWWWWRWWFKLPYYWFIWWSRW